MNKLTYEFLRSVLSGDENARDDSYVNSPLYYMLTGRKGAQLYRNDDSALVTCAHPHTDHRLLVFPEIGHGDYSLTAAVLNMITPPANGVQLARYHEDDLKKLKKHIDGPANSNVSAITVTEENVLDWRYPVRVLDTALVAALEGHDFQSIRSKFKQAASHITHVPLNRGTALRLMKACLKYWEGSMIYNSKDSENMSEFYVELFKVMEDYPEMLQGLLFMEGKKPLGFSIWDQPTDHTSNLLANLSDGSVTGLADYQTITVCRTLRDQGIQYLNRGGSETQNLDAFKAKFKPAKTINILSADVIYKKPKHHNIEVHTLVAG